MRRSRRFIKECHGTNVELPRKERKYQTSVAGIRLKCGSQIGMSFECFLGFVCKWAQVLIDEQI